MKYYFINSVVGCGSTGKIVAETARKLIEEGHDCRIAWAREKAKVDDLSTYRIGKKLDYYIHGIGTRLYDAEGFGSKKSTEKLLLDIERYNPDVIWLHNIHGYYVNVEMLFDYIKNKKSLKVMWTLHDCWAFTGHCAFFNGVGCYQWKEGCTNDCPQKNSYPACRGKSHAMENYNRKKKAFTGVEDMTIITPSQWHAKLIKESFLGNYPVEVRYNTVNKEVFRPTESDFRKKHGLEDKKIVLGVSMVWYEIKGLDKFIQIADKLGDEYQVVLVGLTEKQISKLPSNVLGLKRTNSQKELAEIYSAADIFLNLSMDETFGLTVLEAVCCGTKALVLKGTACEEVAMLYGGKAVDNDINAICRGIKEM